MNLDFTGLTSNTPTSSLKITYKSVLNKRRSTTPKTSKTPENGKNDGYNASVNTSLANEQLAETLRLIDQGEAAETILLPALLALRYYTGSPELVRILG